jgi:hypothetical protein
MRWVSQAVAGGGFDDDGHARQQGRGRLLPQAPRGKVEGVDEQRHAACGHLHVLALEQRVFAQAGRVAIGQVVHVTQTVAQFGVGAQREDAAVHVHRSVVLDRAAVGGGDVVIGIAVGLQHLHGLRPAGRRVVCR